MLLSKYVMYLYLSDLYNFLFFIFSLNVIYAQINITVNVTIIFKGKSSKPLLSVFHWNNKYT